MSSTHKARSNAPQEKSGTAKTNTSEQNNVTATEKIKSVPTADQIRLAQITENLTQTDHVSQDKIEQFMQITGKDRAEAYLVLHDHNNDLTAALDAMFEGDTNTQGWCERTKKKKPKTKVEIENKENRRGPNVANENNRDRSASRGRGGGAGGRGGRGRRDGGGSESGGRGASAGGRRGRMTNGGGPMGGGGRGRGGRSIRGGRGGAMGSGGSGPPHFSNDTFHSSRQNHQVFDETIDTWDEPPKIDNFEDMNSTEAGTIDEWSDEWTGSLESTKTFVPSCVEPTPPPASDLTAVDAAKLVNSAPLLQQKVYEDDQSGLASSYSAAATPGSTTAALLQQQPPSLGPGGGSAGSGTPLNLAQLLQQAAPQSTLTGLSSGQSSSLAALGGSASLLSGPGATNGGIPQHLQQPPNILGGISTNVGDVIKASSGINTSSTASLGGNSGLVQPLGGSARAPYQNPPPGVAPVASNYSAANQPHNSIFSTNHVSRSLGNSLSSSNSSGINSSTVNNSKPGVILPSQLPPQGQRPKQNKPKVHQTTSKIPLSAVEMPEDAMNSINMQLTGLQFGSEAFDFLSDSNKSLNASSALNNDASSYTSVSSSQNYANSAATAYPPPPVPAAVSSTAQYGGNAPSSVTAPPSVASGTNYSNSSYHNTSYPPPPSVNTAASYQSQTTSYSNSISTSGLPQERSDGQKTLSSAKQAVLPQSQKLGPEPIPFPSSSNTSTSDLKQQLSGANSSNSGANANSIDTSSASSGYMNMRPPPGTGASVHTTPQKKDLGSMSLSSTNNSGGGNSLGPLVGSGSATNSSHYSSYSLSKTSSSFPSPPSAPYSQNAVQSNTYSSAESSNANSYSGNNSSNVAAAAAGGSNANNGSSASASTNYNSYGQQPQTNNSSSAAQQSYNSSSSSAAPVSASVQYQNNYNSSSHSGLSKQLAPLKEPTQVSYNNDTGVTNSSTSSSNSSSSTNNTSTSVSSSLANLGLTSQQQHHKSTASSVTIPGSSSSKSISSSVGMPPGVQAHHQQTHISQHQQQAAAAAVVQQQQQILVQQQQQQQPQQQHQFVNSNAAAAVPAIQPYFPLSQQAIYSYEELQLLQQRIPHMAQQVPSTLPGGRDANTLSAAYSAADISKFRTDQNSSPVPSAINTQGGHAAAPFIANAGNATMHPMYMYHHQNVAVPSSFPQYAAPAIIQLPPNTGSNTSQQFQPGKLQYNAAAAPAAYYDSQGGNDYKTGYSSGSQGQSKPGVVSNAPSMTNSVTEMPAYKNHLAKSYDKSGFHTSTPPPFNLPGSAATPYGHTQVFLPPMAQHHSTLMHHQLHQDGGSSGGQRAGNTGIQNKSASKGSFGGPQYWGGGN